MLQVIDTGESWILRRFKAPVPGKPDATWSGHIVRLPATGHHELLLLSIIWENTDQVAAEEALRKSSRLEPREPGTSAEDATGTDRCDCYLWRIMPIWRN